MEKTVKPIAIGDRFGKLVVLEMKPATGCYLCRCDCGFETEVHHNQIRAGKARECRSCKNQEAFVAARQIDRNLLAKFTPEMARKIETRYRTHLQACASVGVASSKFETFVSEIGDAPELAESAPAVTKDGFVERVTQRKFEQYVAPKLSRKEAEADLAA